LDRLGLLFAGLKSIREQQLTWQLVAGLLFAALAECKIFTAVHLGISLGLAGTIYFVAFRNPQMHQSTVITAICRAPNSALKSGLLSPNAVNALEYLRIASHPGEVVLSPEELVGPIVAMTKCHVPTGPFAEYMVPMEDYRRRAADLNSFCMAWHNGQTRDDILRTLGVNYLVVTKQKDYRPDALPN
jgi:hypothetical protein